MQDLYEQLLAREQHIKSEEDKLARAREDHGRKLEHHASQASTLAEQEEQLQQKEVEAMQQLQAAEDLRLQLESQLQGIRSVLSTGTLST